MKQWWRNVVKDYFTFSAKERNGLLILGVVGLLIFLFSKYYPLHKMPVGKETFQQELTQLKIVVDSAHNNREYGQNENVDYTRPKPGYANNFKSELFNFDPNTIDADGWRRLGIKDKTINTIQKFLASAYRFRQPEDIRKIYGLSKESADKLIPYVHITPKETARNDLYANNKNVSHSANPSSVIPSASIIDINTADTSEFISLRGIGSKLASRIVNFREKLGGFSSVEQLGETYGISDSTFQKIKPRLQCSHPSLKTININTAGINELRAHPYLKWNIANAIVNYRQQHGNYKSVEDIKKIDIITDDLFKKIAPYLTV